MEIITLPNDTFFALLSYYIDDAEISSPFYALKNKINNDSLLRNMDWLLKEGIITAYPENQEKLKLKIHPPINTSYEIISAPMYRVSFTHIQSNIAKKYVFLSNGEKYTLLMSDSRDFYISEPLDKNQFINFMIRKIQPPDSKRSEKRSIIIDRRIFYLLGLLHEHNIDKSGIPLRKAINEFSVQLNTKKNTCEQLINAMIADEYLFLDRKNLTISDEVRFWYKKMKFGRFYIHRTDLHKIKNPKKNNIRKIFLLHSNPIVRVYSSGDQVLLSTKTEMDLELDFHKLLI